MRREGRQRGMVRTFPILPPAYIPRAKRSLNELRAQPTAGLFTKAPTRPTNHSKFTGKCGRPNCRDCHIEPACKSKAKAKGTHKASSADVGLVTWSAVEAAGRVQFSGFSATCVLDYLDDGGDTGHVDDDDDDEEDDGFECYVDDNRSVFSLSPRFVGTDNDDDDKLSFCDVGFICGSMDGDDEGWCLVEENFPDLL